MVTVNHILRVITASCTAAVNVSNKHPLFPSQGTGAASFDEFGNSKYQNRRTMSSSDRAMLNAFKEISTMADRINLPRNIIVSQIYLKPYCFPLCVVSFTHY